MQWWLRGWRSGDWSSAACSGVSGVCLSDVLSLSCSRLSSCC